ncbi:hypothetical protein M9458_046994, partial [Cirrhinus mrigala]
VSPYPQPGPSGLEPMTLQDPVDPQLGPSGLEPKALQDPADPQPGPSSLNSELMPVSCPSSLRLTPDTTDPDESVPFASLYEQGQSLGIGGFGTVFKGTRKSDGQQ